MKYNKHGPEKTLTLQNTRQLGYPGYQTTQGSLSSLALRTVDRNLTPEPNNFPFIIPKSYAKGIVYTLVRVLLHRNTSPRYTRGRLPKKIKTTRKSKL